MEDTYDIINPEDKIGNEISVEDYVVFVSGFNGYGRSALSIKIYSKNDKS